jgi:hypothetical protein
MSTFLRAVSRGFGRLGDQTASLHGRAEASCNAFAKKFTDYKKKKSIDASAAINKISPYDFSPADNYPP